MKLRYSFERIKYEKRPTYQVRIRGEFVCYIRKAAIDELDMWFVFDPDDGYVYAIGETRSKAVDNLLSEMGYTRESYFDYLCNRNFR